MSEHRDNAQREADLDLAKEPRILLYDIHDELLNRDRKPEENPLHASKRMASLQVKIAEKNEGLAIAQLAASVKTGELLDALKTYAAASEDRIEKNEKDMRQLNRKMLWLTVAGVVLALAGAFLGSVSLWYAHRADQREELKAQKEACAHESSPPKEGASPAQVPDAPPMPAPSGSLPSDTSKPAPAAAPTQPAQPQPLPQSPAKATEAVPPATKEK
jgi:hypothetical protein